jgi:hypothetical protein
MAPSKIPYPDRGQGISFFAACYPSQPPSQPGSPRLTAPGHTKIDLAASYVVARNVWGIKSLRLQGKIERLLDETDEEAFGFSAAGVRVWGGISANF